MLLQWKTSSAQAVFVYYVESGEVHSIYLRLCSHRRKPLAKIKFRCGFQGSCHKAANISQASSVVSTAADSEIASLSSLGDEVASDLVLHP